KSIQLFDKYGSAVHKVYLTSVSNDDAFHHIVKTYKDDNQTAHELVEPFVVPKHPREVREVEPDFKAFKEDWINLQDTHHFFGMINKYKLHRIEALENAPSTYFAEKIGNDGLRKALLAASSTELPIMVFVGNRGA